MKTEVYSWRLSSDLKTALEREARVRKMSVAMLLEAAAQDWLSGKGAAGDGKEEQLRLHKAAAKCIGALAGSDPGRSENVRRLVRQRLGRRNAR